MLRDCWKISERNKLLTCLVFFSTLAFIPSVPTDDEFFSESITVAMPCGSNIILGMGGLSKEETVGRSFIGSRVKTALNVAFSISGTSCSGVGSPELSHRETELDALGLIVFQKRFGSVRSIEGKVTEKKLCLAWAVEVL